MRQCALCLRLQQFAHGVARRRRGTLQGPPVHARHVALQHVAARGQPLLFNTDHIRNILQPPIYLINENNTITIATYKIAIHATRDVSHVNER